MLCAHTAVLEGEKAIVDIILGVGRIDDSDDAAHWITLLGSGDNLHCDMP